MEQITYVQNKIKKLLNIKDKNEQNQDTKNAQASQSQVSDHAQKAYSIRSKVHTGYNKSSPTSSKVPLCDKNDKKSMTINRQVERKGQASCASMRTCKVDPHHPKITI